MFRIYPKNNSNNGKYTIFVFPFFTLKVTSKQSNGLKIADR